MLKFLKMKEEVHREEITTEENLEEEEMVVLEVTETLEEEKKAVSEAKEPIEKTEVIEKKEEKDQDAKVVFRISHHLDVLKEEKMKMRRIVHLKRQKIVVREEANKIC
jgi:hypothetical protein